MSANLSDCLPELEEITATLSGCDTDSSTFDMVFAWFVALLPAIIIAVFVCRWHEKWTPELLLVTAVLEFLFIACIWSCYLGGFRWSTDINGLSVWNIFGKRHIGWNDIIEVTTESGLFGSTHHVLHTEHSDIGIPAKGSTNLAALGASIYQHLGQYSPAYKLEVPAETQTIWVDIPDWIPREMEWINPNPPNPRAVRLTRKLTDMPLIIVSVVGVCLAIRSGLSHMGYDTPKGFSLLFTVTGGLHLLGRYKVEDSELISMHLRSDDLRLVLPSGDDLTGKLSEIDTAEWGTDGKLQIASERLPHYDQASRMLLLGIIRALREREKPIVLTIPDDLLAVIDSHNQQSQL